VLLFDNSLQTAETNWSTPSDRQPIATYETWYYLSGPNSFGTVADKESHSLGRLGVQKSLQSETVAVYLRYSEPTSVLQSMSSLYDKQNRFSLLVELPGSAWPQLNS
jgi:hypothetical protein